MQTLPEALDCESRRYTDLVRGRIEQLFGFGRRNVADRFEQAVMIEPVDPLEGDLRELPVEFAVFMVSPVYELMLHWLVREGLLTAVRGYREASDVTPEGVAVMLMLDATRPAPVRQMRADQASIDVLVEFGRGQVHGEDRWHEIETAASRWDNAFLRRQAAS